MLRGFSAPVNLTVELSDRDLEFLMANDSDAFNRWEAGQRLAMRRMLAQVKALREDGRAEDEVGSGGPLHDAFRAILTDSRVDPAFQEFALTLPSETVLAEQLEVVDPHAIHRVRQGMRRSLAVAGAETVVVSLSKVNDNSTRLLMDSYYRHLLAGEGRASALREAMRSLRATHPHPSHWAPFIALGSDAPLHGLTCEAVSR